MKNLQFNDEETAMCYFAVAMFKDDAQHEAPGFLRVLNSIEAKIEQHIKDSPVLLEGLIKLIKSEPEFAAHPQASKLIEMLNHIIQAYKIFDNIKGETEECGLCEGVGKFISGSGLPCPRCGGSGKLNKKETYN